MRSNIFIFTYAPTVQLCSLLISKQIYCILSSPLSFQDFIGYGRQQEAMKISFLLQERADYSQGTVLTLTPREQLQCKLQESGLSTTHKAQETENHHGHQIQGLMDTKQAIYLWAAALASLKTFNSNTGWQDGEPHSEASGTANTSKAEGDTVGFGAHIWKTNKLMGTLCIKMVCYAPRKGSPPPQKLLVIKAWENYA